MPQAKVQVDPLVDSLGVLQPPPKSHWMAPAQRHVTSLRNCLGGEGARAQTQTQPRAYLALASV